MKFIRNRASEQVRAATGLRLMVCMSGMVQTKNGEGACKGATLAIAAAYRPLEFQQAREIGGVKVR